MDEDRNIMEKPNTGFSEISTGWIKDGAITLRGTAGLIVLGSFFFGPLTFSLTTLLVGFSSAATAIVQRVKAHKSQNDDQHPDDLLADTKKTIRWSQYFAATTLTAGVLTLAALKGGTAWQIENAREALEKQESTRIEDLFDYRVKTKSISYTTERNILAPDTWIPQTLVARCTLAKTQETGNCLTANRQMTFSITDKNGTQDKNFKTVTFIEASADVVKYCKIPSETSNTGTIYLKVLSY